LIIRNIGIFSTVQEERLDEFVDVLGALQLQRVPCVLDDL
jgi:hypothetical protein